MKKIIFKDNYYDVEVSGGDLILQGLTEDVTFFGAYSDLRSTAIDRCSYYRADTMSDEDGQTLEYDNDEVNQLIEEMIQWYVDTHEGEVVEHNLN